jgi:hypothetical protein
MINTGNITHGAINTHLTVPTIFIEKLVLRTNHYKPDFFASVMAFDKELTGHANVLTDQFENLAALIVVTLAQVNSGDIAFSVNLWTDNASHLIGHLTMAGSFIFAVSGSATKHRKNPIDLL